MSGFLCGGNCFAELASAIMEIKCYLVRSLPCHLRDLQKNRYSPSRDEHVTIERHSICFLIPMMEFRCFS